ncbi:MAG: hypothetical protein H7839_05835 [Magnetococcus sp. YQC-5]
MAIEQKILKQWQKLLAQVERMSRRERVQLMVTLMVILGGAWFQFALEPFKKERAVLQRQRVKIETSMRDVAVLEQEILVRKEQNPDLVEQNRIAALKQEVAQLDKQLDEGTLGMVSPAEMIQAMKSMLTRDSGLTLVQVEVPAAVNLLQESDAGGHVYKHELILRFSGGFPDLLKYLQDLERLPWKFFWESVQFVVTDYPKAFITLKIHTLSLTTGLLGGEE